MSPRVSHSTPCICTCPPSRLAQGILEAGVHRGRRKEVLPSLLLGEGTEVSITRSLTLAPYPMPVLVPRWMELPLGLVDCLGMAALRYTYVPRVFVYCLGLCVTLGMLVCVFVCCAASVNGGEGVVYT